MNPGKRDSLAWKLSDGSLKRFSIRKVYSELHDGGDVVRWSKLIWFSQNIPKHAFVLWLAVQNKLMTQDKVRNWGSYDLMMCPLCSKDMDSHSHLFFKCQYSAQLWQEVAKKMGVDCGNMEWNDIVTELVEKLNGNSVGSIIRRVCLAASVYLIWQERNQRIFRDEKRSWEELYEVLLETIRLRLMSLKAKKSMAVLKVQKEWNVEFKMVDK